MSYRSVTLACAALLAVLASACTPQPPGSGEGGASAGAPKGTDLAALESAGLIPSREKDTCGARALAGVIGRPQDMPGMPDASSGARYLGPDSMATMDFSPNRLNLETDKDGRVTKLRCG